MTYSEQLEQNEAFLSRQEFNGRTKTYWLKNTKVDSRCKGEVKTTTTSTD